MTQKLYRNELFVLASQATQVYYIKWLKDSTWAPIIETKPRNIYELLDIEGEPYQEEYIIYDIYRSQAHDNFEEYRLE